MAEKIWRYMDLPKFIVMISSNTIYFPAANKFNDPFEGYFPESWLDKNNISQLSKTITNREIEKDILIKDIRNLNLSNPQKIAYVKDMLSELSFNLNKIDSSLQDELEEHKYKNGVTCWYKGEHESEAMWKLYSTSGQGIAIESTTKQLVDSMVYAGKIEFESVIYIDEETPKNGNGKKSPLFFKRKAFSYEQEFRGIIELEEKNFNEGSSVNCDLERLINRIHVSPLLPKHFVEVIAAICNGKFNNLEYLIKRSTLLDKPDFTIKSLAHKLTNS
jgi:Protein of unknown function (DUF2971)